MTSSAPSFLHPFHPTFRMPTAPLSLRSKKPCHYIESFPPFWIPPSMCFLYFFNSCRPKLMPHPLTPGHQIFGCPWVAPSSSVLPSFSHHKRITDGIWIQEMRMDERRKDHAEVSIQLFINTLRNAILPSR